MSIECFLPAAARRDAGLRLVCLPYAGGGAAVFHRWKKLLPPAVDLLPVTLPGREARIGEPPRTDLRQLARELADELAPRLDCPWVVLGHSMGAWIALELAREAGRRGAPPQLVVVAASRAPQAGAPATALYALPDDQFVDAVSRQFDGIPPAVRGHDELLKLLLPALRADFQMLETYQPEEELPLATEIMALGGADDPAVSAIELNEWRRHTSGRFSARLFPGGHFFLFRGAESSAQSTGDTASAQEPAAAPPAVRSVVERLARLLPTGETRPR